MLNLSPQNSYPGDKRDFSAIKRVEVKDSTKRMLRAIYILFFIVLIVQFLPWTQNISNKGKLVTLRPEQRPQTINTVISGRIEKWFVKDGDPVKKGDTILYISETKQDYFDPQLVNRTEKQLKNKELSVVSYGDKVQSLDARIDALSETGRLKLKQTKIKLQQAQLKLKADSMELQTAQFNCRIAEQQFERIEKLFEKDLKSQTEVETRRLSLQRAQANLINAQQKLLQAKNDIIDLKVEYNSVEAKYRDEVSKAESDKFAALSSMYDAEVDVTKLQTQVANYSIRNGLYYILAPQDGIVTKVLSSGIGETIKEGDAIATIMPAIYDMAIEMYIRPLDLPLVQKGQKVRIQFDGWPAIVFSGWPNTSYGTFGGEVFAVDNFASDDGTFRVLIAPDKKDRTWPEQLRVGGGTKSMILLNDVPIGYELWRVVNGFPPEFYEKESKDLPKKSKK
jgi:multidrug efflux pump subunit AcrA (membrane-fusion protein)